MIKIYSKEIGKLNEPVTLEETVNFTNLFRNAYGSETCCLIEIQCLSQTQASHINNFKLSKSQ